MTSPHGEAVSASFAWCCAYGNQLLTMTGNRPVTKRALAKAMLPESAADVNHLLRKFCSFFILGWVALSLAACSSFVTGGSTRHLVPLSPTLVAQLASMGSSPAEAMLIRIFKEESVLEVWKRTASGQFRLLKTYEICAYSGDLGPKFREGDRQSPEGIYTVTPGLMNPNSNYHLAFNTGFPNKFDRINGRTGSHLMVHGDCSSVGCYAMTDQGISEIYALARETFAGGNSSFQLQIFPFRMTPANMARHYQSQHMAFWSNIKEAYDHFEVTRTPPSWDVCERQYIFNTAGRSLDAAGPCPPRTRIAAVADRMQSDAAEIERLLAGRARQEQESAAIAARGEAINDAVSGFFGGIGSLFTGSAPQSASP